MAEPKSTVSPLNNEELKQSIERNNMILAAVSKALDQASEHLGVRLIVRGAKILSEREKIS